MNNTATLETKPNRAFNGKTMKDQPVKAVVVNAHYMIDGDTIATGTTASEAKLNAMAVLLDAFRCNRQFPEVRIAVDGSVFVGRETREGEIDYTRYSRDETGRTRSCGGCMSRLAIRDEATWTDRPVSLGKYMDNVVEKYNEAIS